MRANEVERARQQIDDIYKEIRRVKARSEMNVEMLHKKIIKIEERLGGEFNILSG